MFIIILFGIKQLKKNMEEDILKIYQLSCFVGHPVYQVCSPFKLSKCPPEFKRIINI